MGCSGHVTSSCFRCACRDVWVCPEYELLREVRGGVIVDADASPTDAHSCDSPRFVAVAYVERHITNKGWLTPLVIPRSSIAIMPFQVIAPVGTCSSRRLGVTISTWKCFHGVGLRVAVAVRPILRGGVPVAVNRRMLLILCACSARACGSASTACHPCRLERRATVSSRQPAAGACRHDRRCRVSQENDDAVSRCDVRFTIIISQNEDFVYSRTSSRLLSGAIEVLGNDVHTELTCTKKRRKHHRRVPHTVASHNNNYANETSRHPSYSVPPKSACHPGF